MVSLLIVSHSAQIAEGTKELADQASGGLVPIAVAGGTPDGRLGTSADLIRAAYETVAAPDGVVVLLDLGSAVLSAEIALEGVLHPFQIVDAPLVEGAVLAAVEASLGSGLAQTAAASERARELRKTGG